MAALYAASVTVGWIGNCTPGGVVQVSVNDVASCVTAGAGGAGGAGTRGTASGVEGGPAVPRVEYGMTM